MNEVEHNTAFILHKRLSCFSHSLQVVVRKFDTVKAPKRALSIAHKLVSKVCKSVKEIERLISLSGHKLVNDVPIRWNSTFIMISCLLEVRTELSKVLQELSWNNLQNSERKQLENLHSLLKPFAKCTALTSGEEYTTISMVIPVLMELNCHLDVVGFIDSEIYNINTSILPSPFPFNTLPSLLSPSLLPYFLPSSLPLPLTPLSYLP